MSLSSIGAAVIGSAYGQAVNNPAGWGQGWDAYGQRFGADMARVASYNFFGTFVIASVTHEDPRFYVRKDLNFGQSVEYAAKPPGDHAQRLGSRGRQLFRIAGTSGGRRVGQHLLPSRQPWVRQHDDPLLHRRRLEICRISSAPVLAGDRSETRDGSGAHAGDVREALTSFRAGWAFSRVGLAVSPYPSRLRYARITRTGFRSPFGFDEAISYARRRNRESAHL